MKKPSRTCDGCTSCCEGWLSGTAHGHQFSKGKPCFFLAKKGCSIYPDRPQDPCVKYKCSWLNEEVLPMWFRPDLSKVIVSKKEKDSIVFYDVVEAGKVMEAHILNWIMTWAIQNQHNLMYQIDGSIHRLGSPEFNALVL
jgi:uncharacterized cysteine cluster protein YcgN (CxxCxxCC family)